MPQFLGVGLLSSSLQTLYVATQFLGKLKFLSLILSILFAFNPSCRNYRFAMNSFELCDYFVGM